MENQNVFGDSEERYRKLAENFPNGVVITYDKDLRVTFIAGRGLETLGCSPDFFVGKLLCEIAPPEVVAIAEPHFRAAFAGATETYECPFPDGRVYFAAVAPLRNGNGLINEILVISQDITEAKQNQAALARMAAIVECSEDAIIGKTLDGIITSWNRGAEHVYGYAAQEVIGRPITILFPPHRLGEESAILENVRRRNAVDHYETERLTKDGRVINVSLTVSPIDNAAGLLIAASSIARDITDRKRAEDLAQAAHARTESVLAGVADIHILFDRQWRYLYVNEAAVRAMGRPRQQILGNTLWQLYPEIVGTELERQYHRAMDERVAVSFDFHYVRTNTWWENRFFPAPEGLAVFATDITARKHADEQLREYEKVVEGLDEMIVVVDRGYRYLLANRTFLNYRGLKSDEIVGRSVSEFQEEATFELVKQKLDECFQGKVVKYELRYSYPNLGERDLFLSYFPIEGPGGVDRAACVLRDITEQKRAEKALREAEQKYRDIFENAGEGMFQSTPEGQYIEANPALARIHGLDSPAELIRDRKDISREVYVDPARREEFKQLIEAQGFLRGFEHQIFRRDGSKIWVSVNAHVVRDDNGRVLYYEGTVQNINDRRRAETRSAVFATLARKLSGASTKLEAAQIIAETARELFGWDACSLNLYDAERDIVRPMLNVDTVSGQRVDVTSSTADRAPTARTRRVIEHGPELILRAEPVQFDADTIPFGDTQRPSASIMNVPIRHAARMVGLLSIQSYAPRAYETAALNDLQSLADHCGEALNRIHTEELFFESEERFRQMAHHFEDVVWLTDKNVQRVLYINPAYERIFRRTSESLHDRLDSFLDKIHPDDRAEVERILENERQGVHEASEYRIVWPDGSIRWILRRTFPIRNTEGEIHLIGGIAQDITERKQFEESLKLFRNLIDQSTDAIEVIDPVTFRFLDCNESALRSLGYSREEFLALTIFDIDPLITRGMIAAQEQEMHETGFALRESVHRRKDGTTFPVEVNVKLVKLEKFYRLAVVRDISSRQRAEAALRESEERYRELFENAKDAIYVHDLSGRYVSVNRAAEKLTGYSRAEIVGKHYSNFLAPRNLKDARANLCKKLDLENETTYEVLMVTKDRQSIPVEVSSRLIYENGVAMGVQGIVRDITDRKRAQEAVQNYSRRVIEAQEAERHHIARELHDEIGQVLTAVKINLQTIQRLSPATPMLPLDESISIVDEALGQVRELSIELRPALLDDLGLSAALRWYVDRYAQRTGIVAEIRNGFEDEGRLPRELETACFRIVQEALTNVVRHAQAANVAVELERSRERVLLTITDDGMGFDVQGMLGSPSASRAIGLRGMEERAQALLGRIEIESALQKGTRVRATFPLRQKA